MNFKHWLIIEEKIEVPPYKGNIDINTWERNRVDVIVKNTIKNDKVVTIYPIPDCVIKIKNFSNKKLLDEIRNTLETILHEPDKIRGHEKDKIEYLKQEIKKGYKFNFFDSFDCIKTACKEMLLHMENDTEIKTSSKSLVLPKPTFIFLCKWASVLRTVGAISNSLDKCSSGIDQVKDDDWQDIYYSYKEVENLFPILNSVINSINHEL